MLSYTETPIQPIKDDLFDRAGIQLLIKREDLNHPYVSGNKWWKLKYNLDEARKTGYQKILTFGGAFSNHVYGTATAANELGFESVGVIRGEEIHPLNPTLSHAVRQGMKLHFISREEYRKKADPQFIGNLKSKFGECYVIPEGGTNALALRGCEEFASTFSNVSYDYLCLPVGTGGTLAGMIKGLPLKKIVGFSVLKNGEFLKDEVASWIGTSNNSFWDINTDFHFGGYAKFTKELTDFIDAFQTRHRIPLERVYTGKMMFGIFELIRVGYFEPGSTVLAVHTGGLRFNLPAEQHV